MIKELQKLQGRLPPAPVCPEIVYEGIKTYKQSFGEVVEQQTQQTQNLPPKKREGAIPSLATR